MRFDEAGACRLSGIYERQCCHSVAAQLVALARQYSIAVIYGQREFAAAGGLMSYGSQLRAPIASSATTQLGF